MFVDFFYVLRESGIPVTPTSFLRLHQALKMGLVTGLDDFYTAARAILVIVCSLTIFMELSYLIFKVSTWMPRHGNFWTSGSKIRRRWPRHSG